MCNEMYIKLDFHYDHACLFSCSSNDLETFLTNIVENANDLAYRNSSFICGESPTLFSTMNLHCLVEIFIPRNKRINSVKSEPRRERRSGDESGVGGDNREM